MKCSRNSVIRWSTNCHLLIAFTPPPPPSFTINTLYTLVVRLPLSIPQALLFITYPNPLPATRHIMCDVR
ncbi:hypothetical protein M430DRAFT_197765 [Amorphotheca resinae ATCC 22711]|uniref:Uncharacterized protein n=1 Tax=Amorphotheca resinae ATCC 22711 TaxID=857342 RepID=A0A2T3B9P2_AMORE|nr:hypothetical protein M430DRAFT_197765 [Amorphotheca resinae ATCC 22711]PSS25046.1 hypothetical protein M430DRAFT_197765 [Amorphotheca resinae ATCC 22711]